MITYKKAESDIEYQQASELFQEYASWLNIDLSFQNFEEELNQLKKMYGAENGAIFLAFDNLICVGCVAVRSISETVAELKRMYVKPSFQKNGIGQSLLNQSVSFAKSVGYQKLRLDTLSHMISAITLYTKNEFYNIDAYYYNPEPNALYFEKLL